MRGLDSIAMFSCEEWKPPNDCLQLRRPISIQAAMKKLLEKEAIAPSAARLCWMARASNDH
jgi:hypothetical protein